MPLSVPRLSDAIFGKLKADPRSGFSDPLSPAQEEMLRTWTDAIAAAVVEELQTNAKVNVTSVIGVTPGSGVSGAGTGTVS
jgi:hypothetical protein